VRTTQVGEVLFREGDDAYDFLTILAGTVGVVDCSGRSSARGRG
jgi:hypothetical protein